MYSSLDMSSRVWSKQKKRLEVKYIKQMHLQRLNIFNVQLIRLIKCIEHDKICVIFKVVLNYY